MTSRERVRSALRLEEPDRVPRMARWSQLAAVHFVSEESFYRHLGVDVRQVALEPSGNQQAFRKYLDNLPRAVRVGDVSTLKTYAAWGYDPPGISGEAERNPLSGVHSIREIADYVFPEIEGNYRKVEAEVARYHEEGLAVVGRSHKLGGHLFEMAQRLRGLERLSYDLVDNPELVGYLLDAIADMVTLNVILLARAGVDVVYVTDDIGTPTSMLLSPEAWRREVKPRLRRIVEAARLEAPDVAVLYHSDGWFEPVIPDLIEIGINAIEPVQPDCMPPAELKQKYGNQLAFWGTVGTQATWAWASPKTIAEEVRNRIDSVGCGGGLVLAPAYGLELDTPWENVLAFFEASDQYGFYTRR
ncbi:MAG: hypothetical protein O2954_07720 [bacterium]|nr:hypothetical protein [bacterium]